MRAKKFLLKKHFVGLPKLDDFELVEEELPNLNEGGVINDYIMLPALILIKKRRLFFFFFLK